MFKPACVNELAAYIGIGPWHSGGGAFFVNNIRAVRAPLSERPGGFDATAEEALGQMAKRAGELKIGGGAVMACFDGERVRSWSSKMLVVGSMKDAPSAGNNGANLLGIAYKKACERADTLRNSASGTRPPLVGQFGWQGGMVARTKSGYAIAAFSGGKSEDEVEVSRAGLNMLMKAFQGIPPLAAEPLPRSCRFSHMKHAKWPKVRKLPRGRFVVETRRRRCPRVRSIVETKAQADELCAPCLGPHLGTPGSMKAGHRPRQVNGPSIRRYAHDDRPAGESLFRLSPAHLGRVDSSRPHQRQAG